MKGSEHATLERPPNHRLFDAVNQDGNVVKEKLSPVLQHRLESKNSAPLAPAPVINLSLGNDLLGLGLARAMQPSQNAGLGAHPGANLSAETVLPSNRGPGDDMSIKSFCARYDLSDDVLAKLQKHSFRKARGLRFVKITDLKEMGFEHGEIADLRDTVETWSST
jgi:hypothetical protein